MNHRRSWQSSMVELKKRRKTIFINHKTRNRHKNDDFNGTA